MKFILILVACLIQVQIIAQDKLKVVTSASIFHDMTTNIGKDRIELKNIVPVGGDPHLHEPIPRDAQIVQAAELILVNGLSFEGWINELIANSGTKATVKTITEGVKAIRSLDYSNSSDPHAWMSAKNGLIYVDNIAEALSKADPANADFYNQNAASYKKELEALHEEILKDISTIPKDKRVLITSHDAFQYFGNAYGLKLEAIVGISTESDAQTSDIVRITKAIKEYNVPAIFIENTINPAMLQQIAKDNNVAIGGELFADSLGDAESEGSTYIGMLRSNAKVISNALSKETATQAVQHDHHGDKKESSWLTYLLVGGLLFIGLLLVVLRLNK